MEKSVNINDYLASASAYIINLQSRSRDHECSEPFGEFLTGDVWGRYVDQVVQDGLKVGQPGYLIDFEEECA